MVTVLAGVGVALGFLVGVIAHEFVQHRVAFALGDKTPKLMGRLTLSPQAHVDPVGTVIVPGVFTVAALFASPFFPMFAWGKRHALNPRGLRQPKRDWILVSLAGPAATAVLAFVASIPSRGREITTLSALTPLQEVTFWMAVVAVSMTVFELLPLPGRDGGRILSQFLSPRAQMKMEEFAQAEVLFLLVIFLFLRPVVISMINAACGPLTGFGGCA